MVGGGQLARMTSQAATGLGIGFRVLAADPGESAAQVVAGTRLGDYRSLADLRDFAAGCDVLTFDHEHVPGPHLATLEQDGVKVRPGAAALRFTQDKRAMRERLTGMGIACPRFAPVRTIAEAEAFADGLLAAGAQGGQRRLRRQGRVGLRVRRRGRGGRSRTASMIMAEEYVALRPRARGARGPLAAPAGRGVPGGADGPAGRHLPRGDRPRARPGPRPPGPGPGTGPEDRGGTRRDRPARGGDVRDTGRAAGQRARHAPAQHRPLDHRGRAHVPVRAAPAGRSRPAARVPGDGRAGRGDGQRARRRRRRTSTTGTST